ncbi:MAG: hypothetical protein J5748_02960 [Bacteroidales bacterium]|nr:hypothetical protein [Bacteroidales bacterium]
MKNIFKTVALIAAASFALLACNEEAPSKADVESGFTPISKSLPTVTIGTTVVCTGADAVDGVAKVTITLTGLDETLDSLEVGILSSTTEDFAVTKFSKLENPVEGDNAATGAVTANKTYYLMAVVSSTIGAVYSDVVSVDVPDIPFWAKISGDWKGHVVSEAYGDEYDNVFTIFLDPDDPENTAVIVHFEPYYSDAYGDAVWDEETGLPQACFCLATIDNENKTLSIAVGADYNLSGRMLAGLNAPSMSDASGYDPIVLAATDDEHLVMANGFQTLKSNGSAEDSYAGGVTFELQ